jgi:ABC-type sugar transport system substrate-binding protein
MFHPEKSKRLPRRQWFQAAGVLAAGGLAATGCNSGPESAARSAHDEDYSHEEYVWLCCHINLPLFKAHDHPALKQIEQELGVRTSIAGPDTDDVRALIGQIEQTAARSPAGMMIVGWNPTLMKSTIDNVVESGIPVVCVDADVPESKRLAFIGTDWYDLGVRQGQAMVAALGERKGKVALLGLTEQAIDQRAFAGFRSVIEPAGLTAMEPQNDEGKQRKATEIAANMLQANEDLVGMAGFDSESGPGLGLAIKEAGRSGQVVATCVDAEPQHLRLVQDGVLTACVGQKRELFTYMGVRALFDVNRARVQFTRDDKSLGIAPIPEVYYTGTYTVTSQNVDYFLAGSDRLNSRVHA